MIEFKKVSLSDIAWVKEILSRQERISCEFTFGNIFSYCAKLCIKIAKVEDFLVTKCTYDDGVSYCCPIGHGDISVALEGILSDAQNHANVSEISIYGISETYKQKIEEAMPNKFKFNKVRDTFDYVYNSTDLIELKGKKYQPKRNHISFFKRNFNWSYEKITADNLDECLQMSKKWLEQSQSEFTDDLQKELKIIELVLGNYETLGYVGGLIRVDGEVIAYTMGEEITKDMFCVHFEKAFSDYRGAYPLINQQFVENELSDYAYINREDDVGAENLRKAKNSYYPVFMLEKYEAKLKNVD